MPKTSLNQPSQSTEVEVNDLKKMMISLKQQYEKTLQSLNSQFQGEVAQKQSLQNELEHTHKELQDIKKNHEEELYSLKQQQITLRDLLKKNQEELKKSKPIAETVEDSSALQQHVEQLERVIPYLRERAEEANLETEQLRDELEEAYKKMKGLQAEVANQQLIHKKQLQEVQSVEINNSTKSSESFNDQMLFELEAIKKSLSDGAQENRALEIRYADILKDKFSLEQHVKQMQQQLENQTANMMSLKEQLDTTEASKCHTEASLQEKIELLSDLEKHVQEVNASDNNKKDTHEGYDQLQETCKKLSARLEETLSAKIKAEDQLSELVEAVKDQEKILIEQKDQIIKLTADHEQMQENLIKVQAAFDESELRVKTATQHLGKKVKETTLLHEKMEEQQNFIMECHQQLDFAKSQITQLQNQVELFQKQEKQLQEQLHESIKATEVHVAKWEEKYFKMYDKWQESEIRIRDLKRYEERFVQIQNFLSNLGSIMGPLQTPQIPSSTPIARTEFNNEHRYDLFDTPYPNDPYKSNTFS